MNAKLRTLLESVPDYRRMNKGNAKHKLFDMLLLEILAHLQGFTVSADIMSYGKAHLEELQADYGILSKGCPSEPTLCRMDRWVDHEVFARLCSAFTSSLPPDEEKDAGDAGQDIIAIDGKFMRGTELENGRSPDIVTAYNVSKGIPLDTEMCEQKSNEIKAGPLILQRIDLQGNIVTADAMSCQTEIIDTIISGGGDYLIALKANQKALRWSVEDELSTMTPDDSYVPAVEIGHGRIYQRKCSLYRNLSSLKGADRWKGLKAVARIDTQTIIKSTGEVRNETRYYITSQDADAKRINHISRRHWGIENNLHWCLDARQGQDSIKRKAAESARNLDTIQKIVYTIITMGVRSHLSWPVRPDCRRAAVSRKAKIDYSYTCELLTM